MDKTEITQILKAKLSQLALNSTFPDIFMYIQRKDKRGRKIRDKAVFKKRQKKRMNDRRTRQR